MDSQYPRVLHQSSEVCLWTASVPECFEIAANQNACGGLVLEV